MNASTRNQKPANQKPANQEPQTPPSAPRTIALLVEYEGTAFHGWQLQPRTRTVQGALEAALGDLAGRSVRVHGAGRTDAGVHARGQVAAFETDLPYGPETFVRALNVRLDDDVRIRQARLAPPGFDPRRDAIMRRYCYRLWHGSAPPTLERRFWARHAGTLDFDRMNQGCALLRGEHDFRGFRSAACTATRTRLTIETLAWRREGPRRWTLDVAARSFLHNMVRILVGALVDVGRGAMTLEGLEEALASGERARLGKTASPEGLSLEQVVYPLHVLSFDEMD